MITQPNLGKTMQALNALAPEAGDVRLGTLLVAMIAAHNQLQADFNALRGQHQALLAHMDAGNVTGYRARKPACRQLQRCGVSGGGADGRIALAYQE